jgi:hypothetical protein
MIFLLSRLPAEEDIQKVDRKLKSEDKKGLNNPPSLDNK